METLTSYLQLIKSAELSTVIEWMARMHGVDEATVRAAVDELSADGRVRIETRAVPDYANTPRPTPEELEVLRSGGSLPQKAYPMKDEAFVVWLT